MKYVLPLAMSALVMSIFAQSPAPVPAPGPAPAPPALERAVEAEQHYTPMHAVKLALDDIRILALAKDPEVDPKFIRYLDLRGVPKAKRVQLKKVLDFMLNSLNTKYQLIVRTASLPPGSADPLVIRVNLADYGIDPKAWDNLAEQGSGTVPLPDPFFHIFVEEAQVREIEEEVEVEQEQEGFDEDGELTTISVAVKEMRRRVVEGEKKKVFAAAPWVATDRGVAIAELSRTANTKSPILNGQWFLTYAGWPPRYWEMIGLKGTIEKVGDIFQIKKGEEEWDKLAGVDKDRARRSQVAAIADSKIVTLHNRILLRLPTVNGTIGGRYWASFDTALGINDEDYMNNIANFQNPKIAAKELIATNPNQLQIYAVTDANGNLLSEANPKVAIHGDRMPTRLQDKVIYAGIRNCALCHYEGILPIEDRVRALAQDQIALFITAKLRNENIPPDPEVSRKIKAAFTPRLDPIVKFDVETHTKAIAACNDLTAVLNNQYFESFIVDYFDGYITLEKAAQEAGYPKEYVEAILKKGVGMDYTLTMLLSRSTRPSRLPWERQGYAALMIEILKHPAPEAK